MPVPYPRRPRLNGRHEVVARAGAATGGPPHRCGAGDAEPAVVSRPGRWAIVVSDRSNEECRTMTTARDLMTPGAECVGEQESLADAASKMRDLDVGSLPICGEDNRLKGVLTDRDIVIRVVAEGKDPQKVTAGELGQGK